MLKTRWLDRRIGLAGPYLALCLGEDEFRAAIKHLKLSETPKWARSGANATLHTFDNPNGNLLCVVCMNGYESGSPIEVAGLLVHEAVHVWQQWCRDIDERNPGDEQEAYAVQHIAQTLMSEFARRRKHA